jgi:RNA polymerase sigma factor (sigma-70 family)
MATMPSHGDPDRPLVERWKRANRERDEASQEIHERHARKVDSFFRRKGYRPEDARELTQKTFSNVFHGLGEYRGGELRFAAWLFQIAENVFNDDVRYRHAGVREDQGKEESLEAMRSVGQEPATPEESVDAEEQVLQKEQKAALRAEIAKLPPRMRCSLILHLYHGFKVKEVGLAMNISPETVKALLYQARKRLYERLSFLKEEDSCGDETDDL